jgi:geranylgeranyl pyrophosphate synthase
MELSSPEERERLSGIFGQQDLKEEDITFVQDLTERLGIRDTVGTLAKAEYRRASALLTRLPAAVEPYSEILGSLLDYTLVRSK